MPWTNLHTDIAEEFAHFTPAATPINIAFARARVRAFLWSRYAGLWRRERPSDRPWCECEKPLVRPEKNYKVFARCCTCGRSVRGRRPNGQLECKRKCPCFACVMKRSEKQ